METLPLDARGFFSGILQQGYAFGYLLAAIVYWMVFPFFGWRGLFVAGALPAILVLYIRARVPESPAWLRRQHMTGDFWRQLLIVLKRHWGLFLYVVALMTAFNVMSHGTQDRYQTFRGEYSRCGGSTGVPFLRCQWASGLRKGPGSFRVSDFFDADSIRCDWSRKTR